MTRIVVSLEPEQKRWLDRTARRRRVPASRLVRQALDLFKRRQIEPELNWEQLVGATAGIWKRSRIGSVERVKRLRSEWDHRPG